MDITTLQNPLIVPVSLDQAVEHRCAIEIVYEGERRIVRPLKWKGRYQDNMLAFCLTTEADEWGLADVPEDSREEVYGKRAFRTFSTNIMEDWRPLQPEVAPVHPDQMELTAVSVSDSDVDAMIDALEARSGGPVEIYRHSGTSRVIWRRRAFACAEAHGDTLEAALAAALEMEADFVPAV